jgi:hypothetical protein
METQEQPTEEQEEANIRLAYGLPKEVKNNTSGVIERIKVNCAGEAHRANAYTEGAKKLFLGAGELAVSAIPLAVIGGLEHSLFQDGIGKGILGSILYSPVTVGLAWASKYLFSGKIRTSFVGTYSRDGYFGAMGNLRLGCNWLRIAKMQRQGKIRKSGEATATRDELYYFDCISTGG